MVTYMVPAATTTDFTGVKLRSGAICFIGLVAVLQHRASAGFAPDPRSLLSAP